MGDHNELVISRPTAALSTGMLPRKPSGVAKDHHKRGIWTLCEDRRLAREKRDGNSNGDGDGVGATRCQNGKALAHECRDDATTGTYALYDGNRGDSRG